MKTANLKQGKEDKAKAFRPGRKSGAVLLGLAGLALAAAIVRSKTRQAERLFPPIGQFVEVNGLRLHYIERGSGQPVVLLHGNGTMIEDWRSSGLLDRIAGRYRVIAFDRPGFGHSESLADRAATPQAQAQLLHQALQQLRVEHPILVGHSWGSLVAIAMGLAFPHSVKSLVLLSGYYYPSLRADSAMASPFTLPGVGRLLSWTVAPLLGRLFWPSATKKLFSPTPAPESFDGFPTWMALRPSHLRASAIESAIVAPAASSLRRRYPELRMPVMVLAGTGDRIVNAQYHSARLHQELQHSHLRLEPGIGHMMHYSAPEAVMAAIDAADDASMTLHAMVEPEHGAISEAHLGRS